MNVFIDRGSERDTRQSVYRQLEKILPELQLTFLNGQGKTDAQIAVAYKISPADVLLLRGWYGIKPVITKPPQTPPDPNRKPRLKRPILTIIKDLHKYNSMEFIKLIKWSRNEEIYRQYKDGTDIKKLAKMYFVTENYLKGFISRRGYSERIKSDGEYEHIKGKPLARDLLKKYKAEGKSDSCIAALHDTSTAAVFKLRKKYRIKGISQYRSAIITDEIRADILRQYRQGKPIDTICKSHDINPLNFSYLFSRYLSPQDKSHRRALVYDYAGRKEQILKLQCEYKTDAAIGKALGGISRQRVQQIRRRFGIVAICPSRTTPSVRVKKPSFPIPPVFSRETPMDKLAAQEKLRVRNMRRILGGNAFTIAFTTCIVPYATSVAGNNKG
jgi:hypothetical protein